MAFVLAHLLSLLGFFMAILLVVLTSASAASELDGWFRDLFSECVDLAPAGRARAILEPMARLLAPLE